MFRKKSKKEQIVEARHRRRNQATENAQPKPRHRNTRAGLFFLFLILATFICFFGQAPVGPLIQANKIANTNITATFPFSYTSELQTRNLTEAHKRRIAPVYRIDENALKTFEATLRTLLGNIHALQPPSMQPSEPPATGIEAPPPPPLQPLTAEELAPLLAAQPAYDWNSEDFATLLRHTQAPERAQLVEEALLVLSDILRNGVYSQDNTSKTFGQSPYLVKVEIEGAPERASIQSYEDALRYLRINLAAMSPNQEIGRALYRIIKLGLQPNLVFDKEKTEARREAIEQEVAPVVVQVREGQSLIRAGARITPEQVEMLQAYREELRRREQFAYGTSALFFQNALLAAGLVLAAAMLCSVAAPEWLRAPSKLGLVLLLVIVNLLLLRGMKALADSSLIVSEWKMAEIIAYASPVALATLLTTVLLGIPAGLLASLFVSVFYAMMHGYSLELLTVSLLASSLILYGCRDIRQRAKVVKAGAIAGSAVALAALFIGLMEAAPLLLIGQQALAAILMGGLTGIVAVGLLPLLEHTFKLTTNITLLELTDFNHSLLRRMQLTAPGTYHHSLMVANLAERAAATIGANALKCRVSALYHDIGKMTKPEYFIENQRGGVNPHQEKNPSMSALVIKAHVKEGLNMARQHHLPALVSDAIEQHHGTSLIWFFYHRAQQQEKTKDEGTRNPFGIDQSTYRYDGPKPQTRENAILLIADSVEAASRSLNKPSATNIEELVEKVFKNHLEDGQLDEAPITMDELKKIRQSLTFTLLNTLHQRTRYPERDGQDASSETSPPIPTTTPSEKLPSTSPNAAEETEQAI